MSGDDPVELARNVYGGLVDRALTTYDEAVHADPGHDRAAQVARRIEAVFQEHPEYRGVAIRVTGAADGPGIGISSRARVREALGPAGAEAPGRGGGTDWGAGDRAALTGTSTQYRILLFVCPTCGGGAARAYYDAGDLPRCAAHGTMELVR
ncbi:hypothetical protein [Streptomyces sp. NPDC051636]|uniref:hypothetical protein n=1 Tax=Streptomyces sp. NPDC051636 TaxID=3365663 RepID=UPI003790DD1E